MSKQATVHLQQIINGEKRELHLCAECAAAHENFISFEDFFQGFLNSFLSPEDRSAAIDSGDAAPKCPRCGLTYRQFKSTGRMGCAQCYRTFQSDLEAIFKNVQAGAVHCGKIPVKSGSSLKAKRYVNSLKEELAKAVAGERYEEAAKLRDQIRELNGANASASDDDSVG
jgi:protein arginine kinase activator